MEVPRVNVLGVGISVLTIPRAVEVLAEAVREGRKGYVCVTGVHGVIEAQGDPEFCRILNRSLLTTPDGMPMVWAGWLAGYKRDQMDRVYGPDLMLAVLERSSKEGWTHFFYGGAPGVAEELRQRMEQRFPGLKVVGTYCPPFRPLNEQEEAELVETVARVRPDFFWVGLSTPKQERFMDRYLPRLETKVMLGVGAAFDFHTGRVRQAPRWVQRIGMEWFFRLCSEPRRLWRRYLRNNPLFLWYVFCHVVGIRRRPLIMPSPVESVESVQRGEK